MVYTEFLYFGVLMIFCSAIAYLFKRLGHSHIAGYLVAGAVFHSFIVPSQTFEFLSFLGAVLLLFFVGLEFSIGRIHKLGRKIILLGITDLVVNFGIGLVMGYILGFSPYEILLLGGIVYISSSAVISKILMDAKCMDRKETHTIMGVLIFEDIIMAVMLAFFTAIKDNPVLDLAELSPAFIKAVAFCGFFFVFEDPVRRFFDRVLDVRSDEVFFLASLGIVFLASSISYELGLSEAIGAFFIGSALAESKHQKRMKKLLKPVGYFASSIFFLSFGLHVDLLDIGTTTIFAVILLIIGSLAGKMATGLASIRINGLNREEAVHVGWSLFPRGEFSIILASLFVVTSQGLYDFTEIIALYVFFLMIASTFLIKNYTKKCQITLPPA
ncbi:cation:proton antiporter [Candidatus Altiarchaeota archaeon]